jgi:hypothetical protein
MALAGISTVPTPPQVVQGRREKGGRHDAEGILARAATEGADHVYSVCSRHAATASLASRRSSRSRSRLFSSSSW